MDVGEDSRAFDASAVMRQATLKITHPGCWTLEVTEDLDDTHVIERALHTTQDKIKADLIIMSEGAVTLDEFVETIVNHRVIDEVTILNRNGERARVFVIYNKASSIIPEIVNADFMPVKPVYVTGGHEYWTVMTNAEVLGEQLERLQRKYRIEIKGIRGFKTIDDTQYGDMIDRIYDTLSKRQIECMLAAYRPGYYNWPRDVSANEIAAEVGISGPTFLEHLRKGEHKVLTVFLEELEERHTFDSVTEYYSQTTTYG